MKIKSEEEYQNLLELRDAQKERIEDSLVNLRREGYSVKECQRLLDPMKCFHLGLVDDITEYESSLV